MAECCTANEKVSFDLPAEQHRMSSRCSISSHYHTPNIESQLNSRHYSAFVVEVIGGLWRTATLLPLEQVHVIIQAIRFST